MTEPPEARMPDSTTAHTAFPADMLDPVVVRAALLDLVETLGRRLRGRGQIARALTLTVRLANGSTVTRTRTRALDRPSGHTEDLRTTALQLLERYGFQRARLRRLRLTCEDLRPAEDGPGTQLSLDAAREQRLALEPVMDQINAKRGGRRLVGPAGAYRHAG
ncbi:DinB/UmuC family translesion DNA polymerase [Streptomyces pristinaespiralis]|uniref:DinB/UmuC family translesion DNA polymerase n=1 Tax=Streptomyces pristinaespiralis TaxID=38300 RepID=UPI0033D59E45